MIIDDIILNLKNKGVAVDAGMAYVSNTNSKKVGYPVDARRKLMKHYESQGLCSFCGKREPMRNKKRCEICASYNSKKRKNAS